MTYGTFSEPFKHSEQYANSEFWMVNILLNDTFVDDIITGTNSVQEDLKWQFQLIGLYFHAQFELLKWSINSREILNVVPKELYVRSPSVFFDLMEMSELKVLGLK